MHKSFRLTSILLLGALALAGCSKEGNTEKTSASTSTAATELKGDEGIKASSRELFGGREPIAIRDSVIPGLKEVIVDGVYYASPDGKYFMQGEIFDVANKKNVSEDAKTIIRREVLPELDLKEAITYKAKNQKYEVYVFTDTTCPYCHKLHEELKEINAAGVTIHYYPWPRAGADSDVGKSMKSIWCSKDKAKALDDGMLQKNVKEASCDYPMDKYMDIGRRLLMGGTPGMFLKDGGQIGGYVPHDKIIEAIERVNAETSNVK